MRATLSNAFIADHSISRWRFAGAIGLVSALVGAAFGRTALSVGAQAGPMPDSPFVTGLVLGGSFALGAFVILFVVSSPLWWALYRLRLRGWAASLLAGGVLLALLVVPVVLLILPPKTPCGWRC